MKKTIKNTLLLAIAMLATVQLTIAKEGEEGIKFFKGTWEEALKAAKKSNKLLFVDAYATWCGPCKMMAKKVFVKKEVGDYYNKNFIPVKIDVESKTGRPLASKYQVKAMPTYLFVDGNGALVYRKLGYMPPNEFLAVGEGALKIPALKAKYEQGDRSKKLLNEYLVAVDDAPASVAKGYFKQVSDQELLSDKNNFKIMQTYTRDPNSREFKYFLAHTKEYKAKHGKQALNAAVGILDKLYAKAFKQKDAKTLQQLFNILMKLDPIMPKAEAEKIMAGLQKKFDELVK